MFFKTYLWSLALAVLLFLNLACELKTHEQPPPARMAKFVAGDKVNCLTTTLPYFSAFLDGSIQGKRVGEFWDCAASALQVFSEKSEGDIEGGYSSQALVLFLETYFIEDETVISKGLELEIMRLKQLFVGGDLQSFKKQELSNLIQILRRLKSMSQRMAPYMKVYMGKWEPSVDLLVEDEMQFFESANQELQNFAKEFSSFIRSDAPNYNIDSFMQLLKAMGPLMGPSFNFIDRADPLASLLKKIKVALAGGDEESIAANEWRRFLLIGLRGYVQVLRFDYFVARVESGRTRQIIFLARTVDDIFSLMSDLVSEKPEQTLTRYELEKILEKLSGAYPQFKTSEVLLLELMKIKRIFFGGSINLWTVEEFNRARAKVAIFRDITLRLVPYLPVYEMSWNAGAEDRNEALLYYREAQKVLLESAQELGVIIEDSYRLTDLAVLTQEMARLYPEDFTELNTSVTKFMPTMLAYKNLILSDEGEMIRAKDWNPFIVYSTRFFEKLQYHGLFLKNKEVRVGEGLLSLQEFSLDATKLLADLANNRQGGAISLTDLDNLITGIENAGAIEPLKARATKEFLRIASQRFMTSTSDRLKGIKTQGLSSKEFAELRVEFERFFAVQLAIDKVLQGDVKRVISASEVKSQVAQLILSWKGSPWGRAALDEFHEAINTTLPLIVDDKFRVTIQNPKVASKDLDLAAMTEMNTVRSLVTIFIKGYTETQAADYTKAALSEREFGQLVAEVVPVMVTAGLLSEYKDTYAKARLAEANLFTLRGNGDSRFEFIEGMDYLPVIFSGMQTDAEFKKYLKTRCESNSAEVDKRPRVDQVCYRQELKSQMNSLYVNLPGYLKYWNSFSSQEQSDYLELLEFAVGFDPSIRGRVRLSDVGLIPNVLQYIESMLARFDRTHNGILDTQEALNAYPLFREQLKAITGFEKDSMLEAIFTYMLRYGEPPKKTPGGILKLLKWRNSRSKWDVWADRSQLAKILGELQKASKDKKPE